MVAYNPATAFRKREALGRLEQREQQRLSSLSPILNVMVKAVKKATVGLARDFSEVKQLQGVREAPERFLADTQARVEKALVEDLTIARPDYAVIAKLGGTKSAQNGSQYTWIVNALDGVDNFVHARSEFVVAIALQENKEIVSCVVYNPVTSETYFAQKGNGAFVMTPNANQRLRIGERNRLSQALLSVKPDKAALVGKAKVKSMVYNGCENLTFAQLDTGQTDIVADKGSKIWDLAAGILLVREAGGQVCTLSGKTDLKSLLGTEALIASNLQLLPEIQKALSKS